MSETSPLLIKLTSWSAIEMVGPDSKNYLNSQVTTPVSQLAPEQASFGAHCDAKGKSWSHFYLVQLADDNLLLFQRQNTIEKSAAELNKYGVFSKTDITDSSEKYHWFAIVGQHEQPLHQIKQTAQQRQVAISPNIQLVVVPAGESLTDDIRSLTPADEDAFEHALTREAIAFLHTSQQGEFVPQMLNLHALDGISFNKGCYMGQETVARMRFLGKNKRATYAFSTNASTPAFDDTIEIQLENDSWRRAGQIVSLVNYQDQWHGLAVFAADIDTNANFRFKSEETSQLNIHSLPYSLEYKETK